MLYAEVDASTELQKEKETSARELQWLLNTELPPVIQDLEKALKKCYSMMKNENEVESVRSTLAITSSNSDALKGYIMSSGSNIYKGELQIKLPNYNRGNMVKATINSEKPYFIDQLGDAQNYLVLTLDLLASSHLPYTKQSAIELLNDVSKYVSKSRSALTNVNEGNLFPYKICESQVFNSALPDDLAVEFHVEGAEIVTSVYVLQYHASLPSNKLNILSAHKNHHKYHKYKDIYVTIIDEIVVRSLDPSLEEIGAKLKEIEQQCLSWRKKITVL
ncbi:4802_t:CDS:10 [Paraglomus brasilianum]|uniref:4802_t:CDS:1 n=1 Tax=Paraglomus brasilianum TaxID=144538 RepID=A0A9N9C4C9_9GLOM|nr:4802_t:CDS:10 [Paraglomus brasilianum]